MKAIVTKNETAEWVQYDGQNFKEIADFLGTHIELLKISNIISVSGITRVLIIPFLGELYPGYCLVKNQIGQAAITTETMIKLFFKEQ